MKNIYIAARYHLLKEMRLVAIKLERLGYNVTSRWLTNHADENWSEYAVEDLDDIDASDTLLLFTEEPMSIMHTGGRFWEAGYAHKGGKRIVVIGPHQNVFVYHPGVEQYDTLEEFLGK
jgi:hypothetical protein